MCRFYFHSLLLRFNYFHAGLGEHRRLRYSCHTKYTPVPLSFLRIAQRLRIVVGQFDGGAAFRFGKLANQAHWIEALPILWIAVAKVVGKQRAPAGAEANATVRNPAIGITEVLGGTEVLRRRSVAQGAGEIGMQAENLLHIECVGGNEPLLARVAPVPLKPRDVFVASDVGILAVDTLAGPVGNPPRCVAQKLGCAEGVG